ncbi:MAG: ATP-binding protein [Desulfobacteraceae bacterium]|nr:ATP-binding protein [Desulfobacteraceae bacterium]
MITEVKIKNYKSILDASIPLSPFTLLIGANGTGKSNFLQLLKDIPNYRETRFPRHVNYLSLAQQFDFIINNKETFITTFDSIQKEIVIYCGDVIYVGIPDRIPEMKNVSIFSLNPLNAGQSENLVTNPVVHEDGSGVVQVLDSLKTGDREDLFNTIESTLKQYIPEIEKLSFITGKSEKQLQVREKHISQPIPVSELSEGTRLTLIILTILFQERPPSLICIEEINRGLHPRLFGQIVQLCSDMANKENMPQIIATTHNPYLVDHFKDNESAVVIVEKENGQTTFTTLEERLRHLEPDEEPLGALWYSGIVGGVPKKQV